MKYPFLIRGPTKQSRRKKILIDASRLKFALLKIFALFPAKFVNTKYARNMDLITARVDAAKRSRADKVTIFIIVDKEGECTLSTECKKGAYTCYRNGSEVSLPSNAETSTVEPKTKKGKTAPHKDMSKVDFSKPINSGEKTNNKMAKKTEVKGNAKKVAKPEGTGKATTLILTDAQWAKVNKLIEKEGSIREMVAKAMIKTFGL